jgi:hypothetical protein
MTPTPDEEVIAGVTKGALEFSSERIKGWAARLANRDIAFIEDRSSFDVVADQKRNPEWSFYKEYVKTKELRVLIRIGLALRKLESGHADLQSLRKNILHKHGKKGLHVAQLVQDGDLGAFIGTLISKQMSKADLGAAIEDLLLNVDKYVVFIKSDIDTRRVIDSTAARINANLPPALLICGSKGAKGAAETVAKGVMKKIDGYELSTYQDKVKVVYLIMKDDSPDEY